MASGSCGTRDKLKQPAARTGNPPCSSGQRYLPKRDRFILVGFIWENVASQRCPALTCRMKIGGFFGSMRQILNLPSTPGFSIINPQVERLGTCGVVGLSGFCRILPKTRRSRCLLQFGSAGKNRKPSTMLSFLATKPQVNRGHNTGVVGDSAFFPALPKSASK